MKTPVLAISGYSNSGKTTLLIKIIEKLNNQKFKVGVIKHHGHISSNDDEVLTTRRKKDTDKLSAAGSKVVILKSGDTNIEGYLSELESLDLDLILLEGFKYSDFPKLFIDDENFRANSFDFTNIIGIISNMKDDSYNGVACPDFNYYDVDSIVEFIEKTILKGE